MKIFQNIKFSLEKTLEYGTYLLIFLLPLQTRLFLKEEFLGGAYWEYGSVSLYLIDILIILLLLISTIEIVRKKKKIKIKKIWYLLAIFEFFVFISIFFAPSKLLAVYGYIKVLFGLSVFYLLTEQKLNNNKLTLFFLSGVFFQACISLWQFFANFSQSNKYLGMAEHDPNVLGTFVIELDDKSRVLRAYGGLDHPNIFALFMFLGIFVFVKYLLSLKRRNEIGLRKEIVYFLILSIFFFSFLLSFSRAAFLLFGFYIIFLFLWSIFDKNRRIVIMKITLSFFVIFLISFFLFNNLFLQRLSPSSRLENISNQERLNQLREVNSVYSDNLFFGAGINNYTNQLRLLDENERESWSYQPIHNVYLLVLAEIGLFGLLSLLFIFFYYLRVTVRQMLFFEFFLIFALMFLFLFDHWLWSLHFGSIFLFFIFALIQRRIDA